MDGSIVHRIFVQSIHVQTKRKASKKSKVKARVKSATCRNHKKEEGSSLRHRTEDNRRSWKGCLYAPSRVIKNSRDMFGYAAPEWRKLNYKGTASLLYLLFVDKAEARKSTVCTVFILRRKSNIVVVTLLGFNIRLLYCYWMSKYDS